MKFKIVLIANIFLSFLASASPDDSVIGSYKECVPWTRINGVEHSKGYEYKLNEDRSMQFIIKFYKGNSKCEGIGEVVLQALKFDLVKKIGEFPNYLVLVVKDQGGSGYYRLSFGGETVMVENSDSSPVDYDFNRTVLLKKNE